MSLSDSSLANRRDLLKGRKWQVATQEACSQCGTRVDSICVQFQGDCFTLGVVKIVDFDPCVLKGKHCLWSWECLGVQFQIRRYIGGGNGKPLFGDSACTIVSSTTTSISRQVAVAKWVLPP
ncbi:hypothetical protein V6N13_047635 [Hibiscus sabdariffa]